MQSSRSTQGCNPMLIETLLNVSDRPRRYHRMSKVETTDVHDELSSSHAILHPPMSQFARAGYRILSSEELVEAKNASKESRDLAHLDIATRTESIHQGKSFLELFQQL